jgi:hypothetical protein
MSYLCVRPDLDHYSGIAPRKNRGAHYGVTRIVDLGRFTTMAEIDAALPTIRGDLRTDGRSGRRSLKWSRRRLFPPQLWRGGHSGAATMRGAGWGRSGRVRSRRCITLSSASG